jgi:hypothetical protein
MSIVKVVLLAATVVVVASTAKAGNENLLSGYHGNTPSSDYRHR